MKAGDEPRKVSIALDSAEILDRVDEMLAWEAIASESAAGYVWGHFCRAEPLIQLGKGTWGVLTPKSLEAIEPDALTSDQRSERNATDFAYFNKVLPEFLALKEFTGLSFARLVEHRPDEEVYARLTSAFVTTHQKDAVDGFQCPDVPDYWRGLKYHLESMGELSPRLASSFIRKFRLPQVARVFLHQHVAAFQDGHAGNGSTAFAFWNHRFFDMNKMPLSLRLPNGHDFHFEQMVLADMVAAALDRQDSWTVELALGEKRTGVGLQTDGIGARELANMLRGADTIAGRRKTLLHWVNDHMRRQRKLDDEATVKVRAHFRGQNSLKAGRYAIRIWPSSTAIDASCNGRRFAHPRLQEVVTI